MSKGIDYGRLWKAVRQSRQILRTARQNRLEIARQVAGDHYADGGARLPIKLNLLSAYQQIVGSLLIGKEPRYIASTFDAAYRPALKIEQDWLNEQVVKINLANTARNVVADSLYATGIFKVSLATPCDAVRMAWGITAGEPVVQQVDFDDFVYGVAAKDLTEVEFIGHRYRCPLDVAVKSYGKKAKGLSEEQLQTFNHDGDQRIGQILRGTYAPEEMEPHLDLWELYLPRHQLIVTFADQGPEGKDEEAQPLWEQKWVGPPWGPYIPLLLGRVLGSALAKAPMMDLLESHLDLNNILRKVSTTLKNVKENTLYPRNEDDDAAALKKANHMDFVPVERPEHFKLHVSGGQFVQGLMIAKQMYQGDFELLGGNISTIGGRKQQATTATQEKILNANAGAQIEQMKGSVDAVLSKVGESLLWYAHYHPELIMTSEYKVPGTRGYKRTLHPRLQEGQSDPPGQEKRRRDFPWHLASLRLDTYSLRRKSPEERLAFINAVVDRLTPLAPLLQQSGIMLDANFLMQVLAELGDEPRLAELYTVQQPVTQGQGAPGGAHGKTLPAQTNRSYTRENVSAQVGPDQAMAEMGGEAFGAATAGAR